MAAEAKFPFDFGPQYEGETVRKEEMYLELAGPKSFGFELALICDPEEVEDGKVELIGPDLDQFQPGSTIPFANIYKFAGEKLTRDLESVFERRIHHFQSFIQGFMHLNSRDIIWLRIHKDMIKRGLKSLKQIAEAVIFMFKSEYKPIQKAQAIVITDPDVIRKELEKARPIWQERDRRMLALRDEDVDEFYSCTLCQSFAPSHVCIITPQRPGLCGSVSYLDAKAAHQIDPLGPNQPVPKGEVINSENGEYSGVNKFVAERSGGVNSRYELYKFFTDFPHTSCGCFQVLGFYIPEVDGIGWVERTYPGTTPNGLRFSTMAGMASGGRQSFGFLGVSYPYMKSPMFLKPDGGYLRTVWMNSDLKNKLQEVIPPELRQKIATENEAQNLDQLREFLVKVDHPVVKLWRKPEEAKPKEVPVKEEAPEVPALEVPVGVPASPVIRIVLKDAKIRIEKLILRRE